MYFKFATMTKNLRIKTPDSMEEGLSVIKSGNVTLTSLVDLGFFLCVERSRSFFSFFLLPYVLSAFHQGSLKTWREKRDERHNTSADAFDRYHRVRVICSLRVFRND